MINDCGMAKSEFDGLRANLESKEGKNYRCEYHFQINLPWSLVGLVLPMNLIGSPDFPLAVHLNPSLVTVPIILEVMTQECVLI